jgi:replicative DNA helicase
MQTYQDIDFKKLYSKELEAGILIDFFMSDNNAEKFENAQDINPEDFYFQNNIDIFKIIKRQIIKTNGNVDTETAITELEKKELIGNPRGYIDSLISGLFGVIATDVKQSIQKLKELSIRRQLLTALYKSHANVFDFSQKIETVINEIQSNILSANTFSEDDSQKAIDIAETEVDKICDIIAKRERGEYEDEIVYSGISGYDSLIGGLSPGTFHIIAGRPGMGKTSFMTQLALNLSSTGNPCCIFSLEMTKTRFIHKVLANLSKFNSKKFKTFDFKSDDISMLHNACAKLYDRNIIIDSNSKLTPETLKTKTRFYKKKYGSKVFFIDYIQNMQTDRYKDPVERIAEISKSIQSIAKETNTIFFPLAQLNRDLEKRAYENGGKKPIMSDLKGSGQLEQDADSICFLYRDFIYNQSSNPESAEIILGKNRDGGQGIIDLVFKPEYSAFFSKTKFY